MTQQSELKCIELFAGAGGMARGLHKAGFNHQMLIEWDKTSVSTLRTNANSHLKVNDSTIFQCDVREVDFKNKRGSIDLLCGGPPCRPFSNAGNSKGWQDHRDMFPSFIDAASTIMPKAILIENVRGLLRPIFRQYFDYIIKSLTFPKMAKNLRDDWTTHYRKLQKLDFREYDDSETYQVAYQLVEAADYGIPQRRSRIFITAFRSDLNVVPHHTSPTHSEMALYRDQWITGDYWERQDLSPTEYLGPKIQRSPKSHFGTLDTQPWKTVRDAISDLPEPSIRGNPESIPNHVQVPGARIYRCHIGSYYDRPAKTLKAGTHGTPGGENMLRTSENGDVRYFTTREAARLQTFDDTWRFDGAWGACIRQLGDAVPVELAKLFGELIASQLKKPPVMTV